MKASECRFPCQAFDHRDGTLADKSDLTPECNAKHSEESDSSGGAQARFGTDEVRGTAGTPMGSKEGAAGPGDGATGAAEHLRWHNLRSPTALDCRPVAGYLQLPKRRFRVV